MGTITSRKRKDNSTAYTAQIRINRDGKTVYQESQTFDRKQVVRADQLSEFDFNFITRLAKQVAS
jgi:hypothetical protein